MARGRSAPGGPPKPARRRRTRSTRPPTPSTRAVALVPDPEPPLLHRRFFARGDVARGRPADVPRPAACCSPCARRRGRSCRRGAQRPGAPASPPSRRSRHGAGRRFGHRRSGRVCCDRGGDLGVGLDRGNFSTIASPIMVMMRPPTTNAVPATRSCSTMERSISAGGTTTRGLDLGRHGVPPVTLAITGTGCAGTAAAAAAVHVRRQWSCGRRCGDSSHARGRCRKSAARSGPSPRRRAAR